MHSMLSRHIAPETGPGPAALPLPGTGGPAL